MTASLPAGESAVTRSDARRHVPELAIDWLLDTPARRWKLLEGTLCFADISGFTALAERLARRGRMGGEELIGRLGGVFSEMLDIARSRGGSLLKFGGDALLLFFQGPDHVRQAASAAVGMRQVLRAAAATPTSVGPLRLSMSVGLHAGPAHFFLVGARHRELVLLGPAASAVIATESAASAGEIALSPATTERLPAGACRARSDGLALLRWRKPAIAPCGPPPVRQVPPDVVQGLLPAVLFDLLSRGAPEPEHRVACIAFLRFSGTDRMLAEQGPDAVAHALDATLGPIQRCLDEEAITLLALDVDRDGGKLFLGSGVPYAHPDDEGNMLRALRRIADLELPLAVQMGVNRGHVFVAEVGSTARAAYSAMGDTTNTAARIAARAPAGAIYAHPAVLDESLSVFDVTPTQPLLMKGKAAALVAYQVGARTGTRRREGTTIAELIGRAAELARLQAVLDDTGGATVFLVGETGMGKSKLLAQALTRGRRRPLVALRGEPNTGSSAYALLRDPLRALLGLARHDPQDQAAALARLVAAAVPEHAELAPLIGDLTGLTMAPTEAVRILDPRFRTQRAAELLLRLLEHAYPGPQLWTVDDAQWCDEASAALLRETGRLLAERGGSMVVARRPGADGLVPASASAAETPDTAQSIELGPMPDHDIRRLIQIATEATPLRPHEIDAIVLRAGGNPLFALELLRAAREAGSFDAIPESLEAAMAAQIDALDPDARRLLRYASVLGRRFSRRTLNEALSGEGYVVDDAALGLLAEFLESDGPDWLRFRSDVICDTTYAAVSFQVRRRLHRHVGQSIEQLAGDVATVADQLAHHYSRADEHELTWRYARLAADRARERYANAEAARFYRLALDAARGLAAVGDDQRIELLCRLGEVEERAGMLEDSLAAFGRALRLCGRDPVERARLLYARGAAKDRMRAFAGAIRDLRAGVRLLDGLDSADADGLRALSMAGLAWVLLVQDRPRHALRQARQAEATARPTGELAALGRALIVIELASEMLEGPGPGDHLREALGIFESLGDQRMQASVEANLGFLCAVAGRLEESAHWLETARDRFTRIGDVVRAADPALNLGEMLVKQRRYGEAEPVLREAIRVLRGVHFTEGANRGEIQLARVLIERAALEDADTLLARVELEFAEAGQPLPALEAAAMRSYARLRAGRPEEALALLDAAIEAAGRDAELLLPLSTCARAQILAAIGAQQAALGEIARGLAVAREQGLPYEQAMLLELKLQIDGPDEDEARALRTLFEGLGIR